MARPIKSGLEYYPMDSNIFHDRKIKRLLVKSGANGMVVYHYLISLIYGDKGYYIVYDAELAFDIAHQLGIGLTEDAVKGIIKVCIELHLFDESSITKYNILTSSGIQKRYLKAKRGGVIEAKYEVIAEDTQVKEVIMPVIAAITPIDTAVSTQIKGNKRKGNKNKEKKEGSERPFDPYSVVLPFESDLFKGAWSTWVDYKKEIKKPITSAAAKLQVNKLKDVPEDVAIRMINKAIESNWQTFYDLADHELAELKAKETSSQAATETYPSGLAKPKFVY
jgi:hypothetical protein